MIGILKTLLLAALMVLLGPSTGVSQTNVSLGWFPSLFAPTNGYYHAGEQTIGAGVSSSLPSKGARTSGASIEYQYWTSATMGTGLELGTYDIKTSTFDHISVMQNYRIVAWSGVHFMDKIAITVKTGAETYFTNNTKGLEVGLGINYNFYVRRIRAEAVILQHCRTDSTKNATTIRLGLQYLF